MPTHQGGGDLLAVGCLVRPAGTRSERGPWPRPSVWRRLRGRAPLRRVILARRRRRRRFSVPRATLCRRWRRASRHACWRRWSRRRPTMTLSGRARRRLKVVLCLCRWRPLPSRGPTPPRWRPPPRCYQSPDLQLPPWRLQATDRRPPPWRRKGPLRQRPARRVRALRRRRPPRRHQAPGQRLPPRRH
ncbi:hypothetical protein BU14_0313s0023 [Porphyra umbilicalis]|uniref:Uncharacterized protein n=1 Tax=Porphyra umbilicalis TaxID=2786 RepID=A0A1X6NZK0_PORUM|nr:hypothetical protein BU14_0313s0023 [Porphyra umbilicalis]|eukprot:OSX74038.1 hypothetical protein BU14_0313s0023 [Porphyra umbilicalis]